MTYVEGASLHQDRGGSTVFARYAFNELVSFVAGWAILLDYVILIAITALLGDAVPAASSGVRSAHGGEALGAGARDHRLGRAQQHPRLRRAPRAARRDRCVAGDLALQALHRRARAGAVLQPARRSLDPIHLGSAPTLVGPDLRADDHGRRVHEPRVGVGALGRGARSAAPGLKRLVWSTTGTVAFLYVGIALVAVTALPVHGGAHGARRRRYLDAPMIGIVERFHPHWLGADAAATSSRRWRPSR